MNKYPDSCYSFWNIASLAMLGEEGRANAKSNERYLLECAKMGGFSKLNYLDYADIMHTFYSLAALSLTGKYELKPLEPALGIVRSS